MGGEVFKRRLASSVAIAALKKFVFCVEIFFDLQN